MNFFTDEKHLANTRHFAPCQPFGACASGVFYEYGFHPIAFAAQLNINNKNTNMKKKIVIIAGWGILKNTRVPGDGQGQ